MKRKELNPNIYIQEGNSVLVDNEEYGFLIFSIPARECCPFATEICKKICYGRNAQELFEHVYNSRKRNYEESLKDTFIEDIINTINYNLLRKKYEKKTIIFRIHETGDFYSQEYLNKWVEISNRFKETDKIIFQAYTKSLPFITNIDLINTNIKIMFSIMPDTKEDDITLAKELGLNTFSAIPCQLMDNIKEEKRCCGNCAKCKSCYTESKDMFVEFHGNRAPRSRARTEYDRKLYWEWKEKYKKEEC